MGRQGWMEEDGLFLFVGVRASVFSLTSALEYERCALPVLTLTYVLIGTRSDYSRVRSLRNALCYAVRPCIRRSHVPVD